MAIRSAMALVSGVILWAGIGPSGHANPPAPASDAGKIHWGPASGGVRAGLSAAKSQFAAGDRDSVDLVLHLQNQTKEKVVLAGAGAEHGWGWQFHLAGGGKPLVPRWDDDTGGQRMAPGEVVLDPGATREIPAPFRQRSFRKWGWGVCPLVPGAYRVTAKYARPARGPGGKGIGHGMLTTGTVQIRIAARGGAWDNLATAAPTALVALLADKDAQLRQAATAFLGEKGKDAVTALIEGLKHPHDGVRAACAQILGRLRQDAKPAVAALANALTDTVPHVRVSAAKALGGIGKDASPAVDALIRAGRAKHGGALPDVRPAAADALGWIGDARPGVVAVLTELMQDRSLQTSSNDYAGVAYALGRLGPKARAAAGPLAELLADKSGHHHGYVLSAIAGIGPGADKAAPALARLVEDEARSLSLRSQAASALGRIGPAARSAIPALERVRDKYRATPKDKPQERWLSRAAGAALKQIREAARGP